LASLEWDDAARIAAMEIHEDVAGRMSRAVLSDDDFIIEVDPLGQNAFNRLGNKSLVVVGDYRNAELHIDILYSEAYPGLLPLSKYLYTLA
jgi:hypothetical protein